MRFLYSFSIRIYYILICLASLFNQKARLWLNGRKNLNFNRIKNIIESQNKDVFWIHCASLGEFEQGRPLIERLKNENKYFIVLTFFSPSGFEIRKNYDKADLILYLPIDLPGKVNTFIQAINPRIVVFVKYEFWFNYLNALNKKEIPVYFISAIFRPSQHFFSKWGFWFRKHLKMINHFFVQDEISKQLLEKIGISKCSIVGDTRFDRVYELLKTAEEIPQMAALVKGRKLFLAGSTWPIDLLALRNLIENANEEWCVLIAPHDIHPGQIEEFIASVNIPSDQKTTYSQLTSGNATKMKLVVVDGIGYLSKLYAYANLAYIGGGFGKGLHNILEAAVFGVPVIIGPNHTRFKEAMDLKRLGGAFAISKTEEIKSIAEFLMQNPEKGINASKICNEYVKRNLGATEQIACKIEIDYKKIFNN